MQSKAKANSKNMEEYLQGHEFLRETIQLHLDLEEKVRATVKALRFPNGGAVAEQTANGLPLLQEEKLRNRVIDALVKNIPQVLDSLENLEAPQPMVTGLKDFAAYVKRAEGEELKGFLALLLQQEKEKFSAACAEAKLTEPLVRTLLWQMVSALVPKRLKEFAFWEEETKWQKNYCPVCGRQPVMAQLRKEQEGRSRYLSCGGCHTIWPYKRVGCAYCGNEDLKKMHILEPEGEEDMRLDVCDECHAYLKTYGREGREDVFLRDYATLHLDLLGEEKNLIKKGNAMLE